MRTRLVIVLLLISGTLAGVFGANILTSSGSTIGVTTQVERATFRFHGRVRVSGRSNSFPFQLPATASVHASLRWGNGRARLREQLRHDGRTVRAGSVTRLRRRQFRDYGGVRPNAYRLRVTALESRSSFDALVEATWTVIVSDPTGASGSDPTPSPAGATGSSGAPASTGSTGASDTPSPPPDVVRTPPPVWAAAFMDSSQTQATLTQAVTQAKTFDVIVATKGMYRPWVSQMKAANPNLLLLVYLNGAFSMNDGGSNYPSTWYARDSSGNKIRSVQFGNYLMDVSNPGWIGDVQNRCATFETDSGYDGCFEDTLGVAPLNPSYVTGLPINQATGTTWTKRDWLNATEHIAASSGTTVDPAPVYANGIANGRNYFAPDGAATSRLLDGARGAMVELFLRAPGTSVTQYEKESQWLQEVQMLQDSAANGRVLLTMTKVWTTATQAQKDSWNRFALSSFLLGYTPGYDWFSFRYDHSTQYDSSYWDAKIGTPTAAFASVGGAYQRPFTNGRVLVNPTTSSVTVSLGSGSWTSLEGSAVSGSITLEPHTGEVLTNA